MRLSMDARKWSSRLARVIALACWIGAVSLLVFASQVATLAADRLAAVTAGGTLALAGSALVAWLESRALVSETRALVKATVAQAQAAQAQAATAAVQADEARRQREAAEAQANEARRQSDLADHALDLSVRPSVTITLAARLDETKTETPARIELKNDGPGVAYQVHIAVHAFRGSPPEHRFWSGDTALRQLGAHETCTSIGGASQPGQQAYRTLTDMVALDQNDMAIAVGFSDARGRRYRLVHGRRGPDTWRPDSGDPQPDWAQRWPE